MNIAIIGAGNGGLTMAAHLSLEGHEVRVYDKFPEAIEDIQKMNQIALKGVLGSHVLSLKSVSTNLLQTIRDAEIIMVVTPAFAHRELAESMAPFLDPAVPICLHPGRTGGALEFAHAIKSLDKPVPALVEAQTLLYACRKTGPSEVTLHGIKKEVDFAVFPSKHAASVAETISNIFPRFRLVPSVLETSLLNIGAVFHPTPTLLNIGWIEHTNGQFQYYMEGISPSVAKVLESLDKERMRVASALGVPSKSALQWILDVYGVHGTTLYESLQANTVYSGIQAPPSIDTRYIKEDVPMSLVPLTEFGKLAGVPTPTMDAIITLASTLHGKDYRSEGRTLERMGINGLSIEQLRKYVQEGVQE